MGDYKFIKPIIFTLGTLTLLEGITMIGTGKSAFNNVTPLIVSTLKFTNETTVKISDATHSLLINGLESYAHKGSVTMDDYANLAINTGSNIASATKFAGVLLGNGLLYALDTLDSVVTPAWNGLSGAVTSAFDYGDNSDNQEL